MKKSGFFKKKLKKSKKEKLLIISVKLDESKTRNV